MNLKVLFVLLMYWSLMGLVLYSVFSVSFNDAGYVLTDGGLNDTDLSTPETDTGGLFTTGVSFGRFFTLMLFGVGLPGSTPVWFVVLFSAWQTLVTILTAGFIISAIWNG